jgi:hypothetical protein
MFLKKLERNLATTYLSGQGTNLTSTWQKEFCVSQLFVFSFDLKVLQVSQCTGGFLRGQCQSKS